ncbi:WcaI family glycosyltransferase [Robertkochia sp. 1368]|nr:WcaI family glycosyltransferase [Robertkochia sediminum]
MKNVTIIGINFYPEDTAIGLYSTGMAKHFQNESCNVNVVTGFPYYPAWKISEEYRFKKRYLEENIDGITIYRYKQYVPKKPTFISRIFHLLDFTFGSIRNVFKIDRTDLIIVIVPFTSSLLLGTLLRYLKGGKLWVHVQDFEFDAASQAGLSNGQGSRLRKGIFNMLFKLEKFLFSKVDGASTISFAMLKKLRAKTGLTDDRLLYFPNWVDPSEINPNQARPHDYFNKDKFNILYSGNIGEKQDWQLFVDFVKRLDTKLFNVVLVGDGAKREWVREEMSNLTNIQYHPPVPFEDLNDLLCGADLHILFQKAEVIDSVMPSKLLGMFASGVPSLVTGNKESEVASIFEKSQCGYYDSTGEIYPLIDFANKLQRDLSYKEELGLNARRFIIKNFSSQEILNAYSSEIESLFSSP